MVRSWKAFALRTVLLIIVAGCLGEIAHAIAALAALTLDLQETPLRWTFIIMMGGAWGWYAERVMDYFKVPPWRHV